MAAQGGVRAVLSPQGAVRQSHLDERDGGLSTEKPPADEPSTSYTYPDWIG